MCRLLLPAIALLAVLPFALACTATKTCTPPSTVAGTSVACTITLTGPSGGNGMALQGDTITDTVTSPPHALIVACQGAAGGLSCGAPAGNTVTVTCTAPSGCPNGAARFGIVIFSGVPGVLAEDMEFHSTKNPGANGAIRFTPPSVTWRAR